MGSEMCIRDRTLTSPIINANTSFQVNGVDINTMYAPAAPALDSYALESEVSSFYATKTSVNTKAPLNDLGLTGTITAPNINATTALQINGTSTNTLYASKPWVQCVVNNGGGILSGSSVGRVTPTITRTSGQAVGAYDITFTTHPNSYNFTHSIQVRADSGFATGVISNVAAGSCKVRLYNASQVLTDYQFSFVVFA